LQCLGVDVVNDVIECINGAVKFRFGLNAQGLNGAREIVETRYNSNHPDYSWLVDEYGKVIQRTMEEVARRTAAAIAITHEPAETALRAELAAAKEVLARAVGPDDNETDGTCCRSCPKRTKEVPMDMSGCFYRHCANPECWRSKARQIIGK